MTFQFPIVFYTLLIHSLKFHFRFTHFSFVRVLAFSAFSPSCFLNTHGVSSCHQTDHAHVIRETDEAHIFPFTHFAATVSNVFRSSNSPETTRLFLLGSIIVTSLLTTIPRLSSAASDS